MKVSKKSHIHQTKKKRNCSKKQFLFISLPIVMLFLVPFLISLVYIVIPGKTIKALRIRSYSAQICDHQGYPLRVIPLDEGLMRQFCYSDSLSEMVRNIFLTSEDSRFFYHPGVDLAAIIRATRDSFSSNEIVSGASTITMQAARIINPHQGGYLGKIKECLDAVKLELYLSKEEILTIWISNIPFGYNVEGLESASWKFFNCQAISLSVEEAAILAIIPRSPFWYSPLNHPKALKEQARELLERSESSFFESNLDEAIATAVRNLADNRRLFLAPHFCDYMMQTLDPTLLKSGARLITSLDLKQQYALEQSLRLHVEAGMDRRINNGAGLVVDSHTGLVKAWVGSVDFFDAENYGQNDGVRALNQPGSTLKPFLYQLALEMGFTTSQVLPDVPLSFGKKELYTPMNYNNRFNGPVRLREALASSLNIPAVYTLEQLGVQLFAQRLIDLGFASLESQKEQLGVGLALGNAEVSLMELVTAYTSFANEGRPLPINSLLKIELPPALLSKQQREIYLKLASLNRDDDAKSVMYPAETALIRDILSDRVHRISGFGYGNVFPEEFDLMMKTGTSNQFNNIWAVGLTPDLTCAIWMGNFSGETVVGTPGSAFPASVLLKHLKAFTQEGMRFDQNHSYETKMICSLSGKLATSRCPHQIEEKFILGNLPPVCDFHCEGEVVLPAIYSQWAQTRDMDIDYFSEEQLELVEPIADSVFFLDPTQPQSAQAIPVKITGNQASEFQLYLDGQLIKQGRGSAHLFIDMNIGVHRLKLQSDDLISIVNYKVR